MSTSNPYAPPKGAVRDLQEERQELAGRLIRLLANVLDGIIAALMIYVPALIVLAATGRLEQPSGDFDAGSLTLPIALCVIGAIA